MRVTIASVATGNMIRHTVRRPTSWLPIDTQFPIRPPSRWLISLHFVGETRFPFTGGGPSYRLCLILTPRYVLLRMKTQNYIKQSRLFDFPSKLFSLSLN